MAIRPYKKYACINNAPIQKYTRTNNTPVQELMNHVREASRRDIGTKDTKEEGRRKKEEKGWAISSRSYALIFCEGSKRMNEQVFNV